MFLKAFQFLSKVRAVKNTIVSLLELADRADDDLDGDSKSELQNLIEEAEALKDEVASRLGKLHERALRLLKHVATGE